MKWKEKKFEEKKRERIVIYELECEVKNINGLERERAKVLTEIETETRREVK